MRIKTIAAVILMTGIAALFSSFGGDENSKNPSGAPSGYTGSPGDGQDCQDCHGGSVAPVTGWITSTIPAQGYTAGTTYSVTVTVTGSGSKGFQVSPQNVGGTLLGTLIAGTGTKLTGSGKYVTQSSASSSNPKTWTFQWTAPTAGTGVVTFYGAFTVSKPVTKLSTLVVNEAAAPLSVTASATPSTINQGQSSTLHATATGGTGSYSYSWTSNPAGFTSTQQNPTVTPTITTTYTVQVNDGSSAASASTTVTVILPLDVVATAMPGTICVNQTSQLNAIPSGGSGSYTYSWTSIPAGFTSTISNPVVSPAQSTTYFVTVNDGTSSKSASASVNVNPDATAFAGNDTTLNTNVTQFQLNGVAANYSSVSWSTSGDGSFNNTGITDAIYYPGANDKANKSFDLTLTANAVSPCTSSFSDVVHISLDPMIHAGDPGNLAGFSVFPNPAQEAITVSLPGKSETRIDITLFDNTGRVVLHESADFTGKSEYLVEVSHLSKGVYFLEVTREKSTGIQKVIIE